MTAKCSLYYETEGDYEKEIISLGGKIYRLPPLNTFSSTYFKENLNYLLDYVQDPYFTNKNVEKENVHQIIPVPVASSMEYIVIMKE